jgi:hypothetical protein
MDYFCVAKVSISGGADEYLRETFQSANNLIRRHYPTQMTSMKRSLKLQIGNLITQHSHVSGGRIIVCKRLSKTYTSNFTTVEINFDNRSRRHSVQERKG